MTNHKNLELKEQKYEKNKFKNKQNYRKYKLKKLDELRELIKFKNILVNKDYRLVKLNGTENKEQHKENILLEATDDTDKEEIYKVMDEYRIRGRKFNKPIFLIPYNSIPLTLQSIFTYVYARSKLYKHVEYFIETKLVMQIEGRINTIEKQLRYKDRTEEEKVDYNDKRKKHSEAVKNKQSRQNLGSRNSNVEEIYKNTNLSNSPPGEIIKDEKHEHYKKLLNLESKIKEKEKQYEIDRNYDNIHSINRLDNLIIKERGSFLENREVAYIKMRIELESCKMSMFNKYSEDHSGSFKVVKSSVHAFDKDSERIVPVANLSKYNNAVLHCAVCLEDNFHDYVDNVFYSQLEKLDAEQGNGVKCVEEAVEVEYSYNQRVKSRDFFEYCNTNEALENSVCRDGKGKEEYKNEKKSAISPVGSYCGDDVDFTAHDVYSSSGVGYSYSNSNGSYGSYSDNE